MTGLRRAEMAALTWHNVLLQESKLHIIGKGDKFRTIFIGEDLVKLLRESKNGSRFVIKNYETGEGIESKYLYLIIKKIAMRAGLPKLSPHDLRRS